MPDPSHREMPPVDAILLFGASGRVGGPAADRIVADAPHVRLRLATSHETHVAQLREQFPAAEIVVADYFDLDSLIAATDGIDTIFVITPDFIDERRAMTNLVAAVNRGMPRHIVRLTGGPRMFIASSNPSPWRRGRMASRSIICAPAPCSKIAACP